jgi:hypothetical protein
VRRDDADPHADLLLRFKGGVLSELTVPLRRPQPSIRTDEDTITLLRRLAGHYPDAKIAGILNRQGRHTARELSFTASRVQSLRHHHQIPRYQPNNQPQDGELLNVSAAAKVLGIAPSTLLRWLNDGFVVGEQITPGAPWQIRLTDELRNMLVTDAPDGWLALHHASRALGISRQTVLHKVQRGELEAVLTRTGRRKGLRINVPDPTTPCSKPEQSTKEQCDHASKQLAMPVSTTHRRPRQDSSTSTCRASCALRFGRNPNEHGNMSASNTGSSTILSAACTIRSRIEGIDSGRISAVSPDFGISTRLAGSGR